MDGCLLRNPEDITPAMPHHIIGGQWKRIKASGQVDIPEGVVLYGLRHFFASDCLSNGIPITRPADRTRVQAAPKPVRSVRSS
ncbi:hypothetical protein [Kitasatospora purpeofusca]|uniref:Tyr recombinase domain-containing protein n=1 Tax=Kitasatospora purpeofusca TaxID=67352 RepID=A0ABZ1UAF9_9ACTN|nr:hypothetical protein [Kitasatospora purpeofusca]